MGDMHEATFVWPEVDVNDVIVTGTFDQWSSSIHLTKTPGGFEGKVKIPWGDRVLYKFVVDGRWVTAQSQPMEVDNAGNTNNVYESPSKPQSTTVDSPPIKLSPEVVELEHSENAEASVPLSLTTSTAEQRTLPEQAALVAQQVKEAVVIIARGVLPENTGPALRQAHTTVVSPVVEAAQKVVTDPVATINQVKESVPPEVVETAQATAEFVKTAAVQAEATVTAVTPVLQKVREVVTDNTPEPAKEQVNTAIEIVHDKGSGALAFVASNLGTAIHALTGVDPLNMDKIPVATPTPTHDTFILAPQETSGMKVYGKPAQLSRTSDAHSPSQAITSAFQLGAEMRSNGPVSSDAAIVPAASAVYPTAPASIFAEPEPVTFVPTKATSAKTNARTDASSPIPPIPAIEDPETLSESTVIDHPPVFDGAFDHEPPKDQFPSTLAPETEPVAVTEAPAIAESALVIQAPTTVESAATSPAPDVTTEAEPGANALELPQPSEVEPSPPKDVPAPSIPASQAEAPSVAQIHATADKSTVTTAPDTTPEIAPAHTEAKSLEQPAASANVPIQPAGPTPTQKPTNGHSPVLTTPVKKLEASESSKLHAFPTAESKLSTSTTSSPAPSSKFGSTRKKRVSIFGKVKNLFASDKEEKKENK